MQLPLALLALLSAPRDQPLSPPDLRSLGPGAEIVAAEPSPPEPPPPPDTPEKKPRPKPKPKPKPKPEPKPEPAPESCPACGLG